MVLTRRVFLAGRIIGDRDHRVDEQAGVGGGTGGLGLVPRVGADLADPQALESGLLRLRMTASCRVGRCATALVESRHPSPRWPGSGSLPDVIVAAAIARTESSSECTEKRRSNDLMAVASSSGNTAICLDKSTSP